MRSTDFSGQDGQFRVVLDDAVWNIRTALIPHRGEYPVLVLRFLPTSRPRPLSDFGLTPAQWSTWLSLVEKPQGLILVSGPTGSGKTTFLYSTLHRFDRNRLAVITVEDPIEYEIEGVTQILFNSIHGIEASHVLQNILRLDPDIIFCGEIRDVETARFVVDAAMTGHLVFSTLHAASAAEAIDRMVLNLNVDPYLLSQTLLGVTNSRLLPRLCQRCRSRLPEKGYAAVGCDACWGGFAGRRFLIEILKVNPELRAAIKSCQGADEYLKLLCQTGEFTDLRQRAEFLMAEGELAVSTVTHAF